MSAKQNTQILLRERPSGDIDVNLPGTFEKRQQPIPDSIPKGCLLVKCHYYSIDPAMRGWMTDRRSYVEPVKLGDVMRAYSVGVVEKSNAEGFKEGDWVRGFFGWQDYSVFPAEMTEKIEVGNGIEAVDYIGALGIGSLTAYFGVMDVLAVKEGDVVIVDGAAGSTGCVVVQMCKMLGATVVATAGSDEKCKWVKESLGADHAFNYKSPSFQSDFTKAVKDLGYATAAFENVGGEQFDLNLGLMRSGGRIAMCGAISQYNAATPGEVYGVKNIAQVITMQLRLEGFIVSSPTNKPKWPAATKQIKEWIASGKLERQYSVVEGGPEKAPQALSDIFKGKNLGKMLVKAKM